MNIDKLKADLKASIESGEHWNAPMWHKRLHDWEAFDRITLEVVPRYKTSGMSGDEWRTGVAIKFWFKGKVVADDFRTSLDAAIRYLPMVYDEKTCPISSEHMKLDEEHCDQPGCSELWIARFVMKRQTAKDGSFLADDDLVKPFYRKFCKAHLRRGDCSREDADGNYVPLDNIGPADAGLVIESPSAFGGVVHINVPNRREDE